MLPRRSIERYLRFLLRNRGAVSAGIGVVTAYFLYAVTTHLAVHTNFFDLYPPNHPYIRLYRQHRQTFGTANLVQIVLRVKRGDLFSRPDAIRKVDRITLDLLRTVPGVNTEQVTSITHPKLKTALTASSGIQIVPLVHPRLPQTTEELEALRRRIHSTEGVRGFFVSADDKATLIIAGFWEEFSDLSAAWSKLREIVARESDADTELYVTGFPVLYAYFLDLLPRLQWVLAASIAALIAILWLQFRTWQGVWIPIFSGALSAVWALGFAAALGLSLDPLVLVIPVLLAARAHSHSVQSMERYHEESIRLGDRNAAIVRSYTEIYPPAMASLLADGLAILTLYVARIPLIQKLAILASFWIVAIFVSVVTLHPILLSLTEAPAAKRRAARTARAGGFDWFVDAIVWLSTGRRAVVPAIALAALLGVALHDARSLKVGDTSPGEALLYADHPYNVAFRELNGDFVGASQLVILAEGRKPEALATVRGVEQLDELGRAMEARGAGGALSAATLLKKIFRTVHDGEPKWSMPPDRDDQVAQLLFLLTASAHRGELDRYFDPSYTNATVSLFYRAYDHDTIEAAIASARQSIAGGAREDDPLRFRLAGGLLGVLAAVNQEVEWSHRVNVALIFAVVFGLSILTYRSASAALVVMLPSLVAQPLCEAAMVRLGIDLNVDSLPVAAVGIGIGIDYGYYLLSRILEEANRADAAASFDEAIARALRTTGKTVLFTGLSLTASLSGFLFFPMKFQAEMALLLALLLGFHLVGALVFIPPIASLLLPRLARAKRFHSATQPLA